MDKQKFTSRQLYEYYKQHLTMGIDGYLGTNDDKWVRFAERADTLADLFLKVSRVYERS